MQEGKDRADLAVMEQLNEVTVSGDDLMRASDEVNEYLTSLPEEDRDFAARAACLARVFPGDYLTVSAVNFRMEALARLTRHPTMRGWSLPDQDGGVPTDETVFAVAAVHPLVKIEGKWGFEPESFFRAVLAAAENEGSG